MSRDVDLLLPASSLHVFSLTQLSVRDRLESASFPTHAAPSLFFALLSSDQLVPHPCSQAPCGLLKTNFPGIGGSAVQTGPTKVRFVQGSVACRRAFSFFTHAPGLFVPCCTVDCPEGSTANEPHRRPQSPKPSSIEPPAKREQPSPSAAAAREPPTSPRVPKSQDAKNEEKCARFCSRFPAFSGETLKF